MVLKLTKPGKPSEVAMTTTTAETIAESTNKAPRRKRGKGETVSLTVRLPKEAWMRLRQFAMIEGESVQSLAIDGFNELLAKKGQPKL
jgi:hypothetical protein